MKPVVITATIPAWLFYFYSVDDLMAAIKSGHPEERVISMLSFSSSDRSQGENPYTLIGDAKITVTLRPRDALVTSQIETLQTALAHERAESSKRQNAITDRISKLSALTFDGAEEA